MPRFRLDQHLIMLGAALALTSGESAAQPTMTRAQRLVGLIRCAPLKGQSRPECNYANFGQRSEVLLLELQHHDSGRLLRPRPSESDTFALQLYYSDTRYWLGELEDAFAREGAGFVTAFVRSKPPGLEVRYRRAAESAGGVMPTLTTDTSKQLQPAWYVFTAHDAKKRPIEKTVDCSTSCEVTFP